MPVEPGSELLHYRLLEKLGEGGMGVVWRALDTSLERQVAIKVLPEAMAQDGERLSRFEREAKLLAQLNHPNIAAAYGLHEVEGRRFIVMELVDGEDLSQRIEHGPIPVDEAIEIALKVTLALEAAHDNGVVHRDLKPANIRIDPEGQVKVLDFGLAKALDTDPAGSDSLSLSPTMTMATALASGGSGTVAGSILGTAAYMSPEQARGKVVDRKADIWAFGCVLYEMLAGRRLFEGDTVSDILAAVLKTDPDWEALPESTPRRVRRLLARCLVRDPRNRLHDIADGRLELEAGAEAPLEESPGIQLISGRARVIPWIVATSALVLAAVGWLRPSTEETTAPSQRTKFQIDTGLLDLTAGMQFALSPDGRTLAYSALDGTSTQIYLRRLDSLEVTPVEGTRDGHAPFFSPDGEWLGFVSGGELLKIPLVGGDPQALAKVPHALGGVHWTPNGDILFGYQFTGGEGLRRVSDRGGTVEQLTRPNLEAGESIHQWPQLLPDQEHVLFTISFGTKSEAAILSLESGTIRPLSGVRGRVRYFPGARAGEGHLLYGDSHTLVARPFDLDRLEPTGAALAVLEDLPTMFGGAGESFQVSTTGTLVYQGGGRPQARLVWTERNGDVTPLDADRGLFHHPRLSEDGKRLAIANFRSFETTIIDLERGGSITLSSQGHPLWAADDLDFVHVAFADGTLQIFRGRSDAGGERLQLTRTPRNSLPISLSPDERYAAYYEQHPETGRDIWILDLEEGGSEPWVVTEASERSPMFSPDGQWIAYTSNRSGRDEVYVRRFRDGDDRDVLVSLDGGREPVWNPRGGEIFYRVGSSLFAVPIELDGKAQVGVPELLLEGYWAMDPGGHNQNYDVTEDGTRFLMIEHPVDFGLLNIVTDWSPDSGQ